MSLHMIRPRNETKDLLLSITKSCEMLIEQTHKNPSETKYFELINQKKHFPSKDQSQLKDLG